MTNVKEILREDARDGSEGLVTNLRGLPEQDVGGIWDSTAVV
tara:strand:+ start:282 stop:407 length:126 start_codon:yes stop_codon:yes gene_type:complete